ncbi:F0F1 ATP synthase subunit epsilon [Paenibacillus radicis (ex Gao et al. 2016)]|uniref:ATP synthase epsilon chain n=1 Tax=Paenibacillus radicis (ex Gao et al. 2016) TaxID=1737354 RepID=A0A917HN54_9BACL|nr:F0F1 ATP synthase subunit epsilon [Paenibacillus radicis (ex Gao et al. 2016)]GGG84985.1 ATP synthase epsilon chain [Paenibacillus radicis (ex Gao et al. 2016)]
MSTFLVEIVTPERKVYAETANMVSVTGVEGELGILPNHIPLVTALRIAPIVIKRDNKVDVIAASGGFIEVRKDKIVILAESAELATNIDVSRAQSAKERAQQRLAAKRDEIDYRRAELALQRAMNRINVTER